MFGPRWRPARCCAERPKWQLLRQLPPHRTRREVYVVNVYVVLLRFLHDGVDRSGSTLALRSTSPPSEHQLNDDRPGYSRRSNVNVGSDRGRDPGHGES